ncbi:hypothetical protein [Luedemannella helvata]|uniref:Uncharacterized protein n=1 Tax=Luedemannella helvata TaxID=349315 RepID=A0ABP4VT54_9ACTN
MKKLEELGERMLSWFVPKSTAAASCPCGSYPYTGPCYYTVQGGSDVQYKHKDCYCAQSAAIIICSDWHY